MFAQDSVRSAIPRNRTLNGYLYILARIKGKVRLPTGVGPFLRGRWRKSVFEFRPSKERLYRPVSYHSVDSVPKVEESGTERTADAILPTINPGTGLECTDEKE